jgi:phosphonopyruvate hydrolase
MVNEKARLLRDLIKAKNLVTGVGGRDAFDAKMIEKAGFDFVWSSSLCISAAYAVPDASLISMSQYLEAARAMNEVISIPIIADCDTGYGNVNNALYAGKLFEEAGIAAISIEDKKFPKDNSLLEGGRQELAVIQEFAGKIRAIKENQKSEDFMVIARVEALIAGWGQEEAVKRAKAYIDAGADMILIHSKMKTPDEIIEFIKNWDSKTPLVLVPTTYPDLTEEAVIKLGKVKIMIYANQVLRAAVKATQQLLAEIKASKSVKGVEKSIASVSEIFELQGVNKMKEQEKKYL